MIEINLSPTKKAGSITNVAGIDLSHINVKMMVFAFLFMFIPEMVLTSYWDSELHDLNLEFQRKNREFRKISAKVRGLSNIQKQVDALKEQEEKLARKLDTVKEVINKRQNPYLILKYLVDNIPDELWLESIELNDRNLVLTGYADDFHRIGNYLESMKNSIFFQRDIDYNRPEGLSDEYQGKKVEVFEIKATVTRFK